MALSSPLRCDESSNKSFDVEMILFELSQFRDCLRHVASDWSVAYRIGRHPIVEQEGKIKYLEAMLICLN